MKREHLKLFTVNGTESPPAVVSTRHEYNCVCESLLSGSVIVKLPTTVPIGEFSVT